jgi:hypothetical protein
MSPTDILAVYIHPRRVGYFLICTLVCMLRGEMSPTYILAVVEPLLPLGDVGLQVDEEGRVEEEQAGHQVLVHRQAWTLQRAEHIVYVL